MEHLDADLAELSLRELEARLEALDSSVPSDEITGFLVEHGVLSPIRRHEDDNDSAEGSDAGDEEEDTAAQPGTCHATAGEGDMRGGDERGCVGQVAGEQEELGWHQQQYKGEGRSSHGPLQPSDDAERSWAAVSDGPMVAEDKQCQHSRSGSSQAVETPLKPPAFNLSEDDGHTLMLAGGGGAANGAENSWAVLGRVLSQEGYRPLSSNDPQALLATVMQLLEDHKDRGERIKMLIAEKGRREGDEQRTRDKMEALEKERTTLQESLHSTSARAKEVEAELEAAKRTMADKLKDAKVKCSNLALQLRQSEHRVKSKEASMDQLLAKLEAMRERETRSKERERVVFRRLHQREPNRSSDSRMLDSLSVLEDARQRTQEEVKALREEVRGLNDLLKDRENYIMRKETGGLWQRNDADESAIQEHLLERCRELERERRHASAREGSLLQKVDELQASLHKTQAQIEGLEEDKTNLILELKSRPTQRSWRTAESRIKELEIKLAQATQDAKEATDVRALRKYMGVAELVRRDKANHRLGLNRVDDLPREVLNDVVKECCRVLEIADVSEVVASVSKLVRVMTSLPRLERFVKDVCTFVSAKAMGDYRADGTPLAPQDYVNRLTMEEVLDEIKRWWQASQAGDHLKSFRSRLVNRLSTRVDNEQDSGKAPSAQGKRATAILSSDEAILEVVTELIELERRLLQSRELQEGAEVLLTEQPDVFLHRVIEHFRYLFQVKSTEGLFPKMNQLYLFTSEMENFTKALQSMLGVEHTSTNALLKVLQDALHKPAYPRRMTAHVGKAKLLPQDNGTDAGPTTGGGAGSSPEVSGHSISFLSESEEEPS